MVEKQKKTEDFWREPGIALSIILMILSLWCIWHTFFWVMPINIIKYMMVGFISNLVALIIIKRLRLFSAIPAYILIAVIIIRLILALSTEIHMRYYGTLYQAVHTGNAKAVERRIDHGCDVNEIINGDPIICKVFTLYFHCSRDEPTPSKNVRDKKIVEILKVLIDKGADINAVDEYRGWSALIYALADFNTEAVELLVNKGADVNLVDKKGYTPLHYAAFPKEVQIFINKGANINARGKDGNTPLHMLISAVAAQILIDNGADINAENENGETPLDLAIKDGYEKKAELLRQNGAKE